MKKYSLIFTLSILSACSSYHNLKEDGNNALGGGFIEEKIDDGLYELTARSNFAPWAQFGSAEKTYNKRATELCSTNYINLESERSAFDSTGMNHIIAQIKGYILCENSSIQEQQAMELVNKYKAEINR